MLVMLGATGYILAIVVAKRCEKVVPYVFVLV
jgi:hypothetical protein